MNASTARPAHSNTGPIGLSTAARIRALHRDEIELLPGLYSSWRTRNRERTIPHGIRMLEVAGNLDNVRRLAGESDAPFRGMLFADSDIYTTLEAVAWELGTAADASLRVDFVVHRNGDIGSPRSSGSTKPSSASASPGSVTVWSLRPAPGWRTRGEGASPASSSATPLDTVVGLAPAARATSLTPP